MAKPGTLHALIEATDNLDAKRDKAAGAGRRVSPLSKRDQREVVKLVIPYIDRVLAQAEMVRFAAKKRFSIPTMRSTDASKSATRMRMATAQHLKSVGITTRIVAELLNRNYDTVRYYIHEHHRMVRRQRYYAKKAVHFVRFDGLHDQRFQSAIQVFGPPDFLHRVWDMRAKREIAKGDVVVFAKGDAWQPVMPFNGDDEAYR